jgi:hypothetical protein
VTDAQDLGTSHVPLGEGLVVVRLRVSPADAVLVRGMLAGHDHLASPHADSSDVLALVTTTDREAELRGWVADLTVEMPSIEVLP